MSTRSGAGAAGSAVNNGRQALPDKKPDRTGVPGPGTGEPPSPDSPLRSAGPLTRKRAASLRTDSSTQPKIEDLSLTTPTTTTDRSPPQLPHLPESGRDLICLCTPAPKVPRPRNAFILYRQHHQSQVVAQNPGLANPEISKIIGERWREESDEHKEQWKRLAEEEKIRHQRQYPDYRYQPRRGGKSAASRGSTPNTQAKGGGDTDPGRCPKCGGRYIATPRTPSTPFTFSPQSRGSTPTANSGGGMSYVPSQRGVMEADHHGRHPSQRDPRDHHGHRGSYQSYPSSHYHHHQYQPRSNMHGLNEDYDMDSPSAAKRRRYDSGSGYSDGPPSYPVAGHGGHYSYGGGQPPYPHALPPHVRPHQPPEHIRHTSIGGPGTTSPAYPPQPGSGQLLPGPPRTGSIGMAPPPPRPGPHVAYPPPQQPALRRDAGPPSVGNVGGGFDESLRLPPLQQTPTTTSHLPAPATVSAIAHASVPTSPTSIGTVTQARTNNNDNRDNTQVSPFAAAVAARSVEAEIMSIPYLNKLRVLKIIAGPLGAGDPEVEAARTRGPIIAIEGAVPSLVRQVGRIVERALAGCGEYVVRTWSGEDGKRGSVDNSAGREGGGRGQLSYATYLQTITDWHARSAEIVKHITAHPEGAVRRASDVSMGSGSGDERKSDPSETNGGEAATRSSSVNTAGSQQGRGQTRSDRQQEPQQQQQQQQRQQRPLLPVALLTDGYSLTISDRFACRVPIADSYAPVDHWQWMATLWRGIAGTDLVIYVRGAEEEEMTRLQAVEMGDANIMKVRVAIPSGQQGVEGVVVGEKVERRLGFEVVEWVRNGNFKEGV